MSRTRLLILNPAAACLRRRLASPAAFSHVRIESARDSSAHQGGLRSGGQCTLMVGGELLPSAPLDRHTGGRRRDWNNSSTSYGPRSMLISAPGRLTCNSHASEAGNNEASEPHCSGRGTVARRQSLQSTAAAGATSSRNAFGSTVLQRRVSVARKAGSRIRSGSVGRRRGPHDKARLVRAMTPRRLWMLKVRQLVRSDDG